MNADHATLNNLHKLYLKCVEDKITEFVAGGQARAESEFCASEKANYFRFMQEKFKTEYDNIIRFEGNNY